VVTKAAIVNRKIRQLLALYWWFSGFLGVYSSFQLFGGSLKDTLLGQSSSFWSMSFSLVMFSSSSSMMSPKAGDIQFLHSDSLHFGIFQPFILFPRPQHMSRGDIFRGNSFFRPVMHNHAKSWTLGWIRWYWKIILLLTFCLSFDIFQYYHLRIKINPNAVRKTVLKVDSIIFKVW
jgi:hypothetical protein